MEVYDVIKYTQKTCVSVNNIKAGTLLIISRVQAAVV